MTPSKRINNFYNAIIAKDAPNIDGFYVPDEDTYVILEGPRLATKGFSKIQKGWKDFCSSDLHLTSIEWLEGPFEEVSESMAWIGGVIQLSITIKDRSFSQTFRASFVLKIYDGEWCIRHEHVSGALLDPYGIGDWLKPSES
jgi:ketosteroid isomerase-like protein